MTGPRKGDSIACGNSFANGPDAPAWARQWEFLLLRETQVTVWTVQP